MPTRKVKSLSPAIVQAAGNIFETLFPHNVEYVGKDMMVDYGNNDHADLQVDTCGGFGAPEKFDQLRERLKDCGFEIVDVSTTTHGRLQYRMYFSYGMWYAANLRHF